MPKQDQALVAAEITARGGKEHEAARELQALGFRVHRVGATISVDAPRALWRSVFAARFAPRRRRSTGSKGRAASASPVSYQVPATLAPLLEGIVFVEPPELF